MYYGTWWWVLLPSIWKFSNIIRLNLYFPVYSTLKDCLNDNSLTLITICLMRQTVDNTLGETTKKKLKWNWVLVVASTTCAPFRFSRWKHDFVKYWSITRVSQYASNTILQFEKQILRRSPVILQRLFYSTLAPQHNNIGIALVVVPQSL